MAWLTVCTSAPRMGFTSVTINHRYERVPSRDEHGKLLSDFMMLIPGTRLPESRYEQVPTWLEAFKISWSETINYDNTIQRLADLQKEHRRNR